jgi:hypothetical protein
MILVVATDLEGIPLRVECSICNSTEIRPASDPEGRWLLGWARSHPCVSSQAPQPSVTRLH